MKLLETTIDINLIKNNLEEFSDLNRHYIGKVNDKILNLIDFEDDNLFLEPTLFFLPVENKSYSFTTPVEQLLFGHVKDKKNLGVISVISDSNGYINLPGFGYLKTVPNSRFMLESIQDSKGVILKDKNNSIVEYRFEEFTYIKNTNIKLIKNQPELLSNYFVTYFNESVEKTAVNNNDFLNNSFEILRKVSNEFVDLIEMTNKEVCVFNSKTPPVSMAALFYFGTAFLNIDSQNHNEVFFIDDLAHQCGHNIFYALTLDQKRYIVPSIDAKISDYAPQIENETRDVYGVFHGLFTYTTIIDSLSKCIELKVFKDDIRLNELIARLGFYMRKFSIDLEIMDNKSILTKEGLEYLEMFREGHRIINAKHSSFIKGLKYDNQDYIFEYKKYLEVNSFINF